MANETFDPYSVDTSDAAGFTSTIRRQKPTGTGPELSGPIDFTPDAETIDFTPDAPATPAGSATDKIAFTPDEAPAVSSPTSSKSVRRAEESLTVYENPDAIPKPVMPADTYDKGVRRAALDKQQNQAEAEAAQTAGKGESAAAGVAQGTAGTVDVPTQVVSAVLKGVGLNGGALQDGVDNLSKAIQEVKGSPAFQEAANHFFSRATQANPGINFLGQQAGAAAPFILAGGGAVKFVDAFHMAGAATKGAAGMALVNTVLRTANGDPSTATDIMMDLSLGGMFGALHGGKGPNQMEQKGMRATFLEAMKAAKKEGTYESKTPTPTEARTSPPESGAASEPSGAESPTAGEPGRQPGAPEPITFTADPERVPANQGQGNQQPGSVSGIRSPSDLEQFGREQPVKIVYHYNPVDATHPVDDRPFYHGTKAPIDDLSKADVYSFGDEHGLYGTGIYLTDNPEVAKGYAKSKGKGDPGVVHPGKITGMRLIDLDKSLPADVLAEFNKTEIGGSPLDSKAKTGKAVFSDLKEAMQDSEMLKYEAGEVYSDLHYRLQALGYDGFLHKGGDFKGKAYGPHNVAIVFPEQQFGVAPDKLTPENRIAITPLKSVPEPALSVGPGAASIEENLLDPRPQIQQLAEAIRNSGGTPVQPMKTPIGQRWKAVYGEARAKVLGSLAQLSAYAQEKYVDLFKAPVESAWKKALGQLDYKQQVQGFYAREMTKHFNEMVPDKLRRRAVGAWIEAREATNLLQQRADSFPLGTDLNKKYTLATELTEGEKVIGRQIGSYYDAMLQHAISTGALKDGVDNYLTHVWKKENPYTRDLRAQIDRGMLQKNPSFTKQRIFDAFYDGEKLGYKPTTDDPGLLVAAYDQHFNKAIETRRFIQNLALGTSKDGKPLLYGSGTPVGSYPILPIIDYAVSEKPNNPLLKGGAEGKQHLESFFKRLDAALLDENYKNVDSILRELPQPEDAREGGYATSLRVGLSSRFETNSELSRRPAPGVKALWDWVGKQQGEAPIATTPTYTPGPNHIELQSSEGLDVSKYVKVVGTDALKDWTWLEQAEDGSQANMSGDLYAHPEVARKLQTALEISKVRTIPAIKFVMRLQSEAKQSMMLASHFHFVQESLHGLGHGVYNPYKVNSFKFDFNDPDQIGLMSNGGKFVNFDASQQAYHDGLAGGGWLANNLLPSWASKQVIGYQEWLFQDYIPKLKMVMALEALERNRERYGIRVAPDGTTLRPGTLSETQIFDLTAGQANAAFGELNYRWIGRSATNQDLLRLGLLAPDFLEARARFVGQSMLPYGREQLAAVTKLTLGSFVLARVLNQMSTGNTQDNHPFSVLYNNKEYALRTVPADVWHMMTDPGNFFYYRMSPAAQRSMDLALQRDSNGRPIAWSGQVENLLMSYSPIVVKTAVQNALNSRSVNNLPSDMWESALASVGFKVKNYNASIEMADLARKFNKDTGQDKGAAVYPTSQYHELRLLLRNDDLDGAAREYKRLLGTGKVDRARVVMTFDQAAHKPMTGSSKQEAAFKKAMNTYELSRYNEARQEQAEMRTKLMKVIAAVDRDKYN